MALGALTLVVGLLLTTVGGVAHKDETQQYDSISGRELFESPAIVDAMTTAYTAEALRRGQMQKADVASIRSIVADSLRQVPDRLPAETRALLDMTSLSGLQHQAFATKLRNRGDERVQRVGLEVVRAVQEMGSSEDVETLRNHIQDRLKPRLHELRQLQDEIFPIEQRQSLGAAAHDWRRLLSKKHLGIMRNFGGGAKKRKLQVPPPPPAGYKYQQAPAGTYPPPGAYQHAPGAPIYPAAPAYYPYYTTTPPSVFVKMESGINSLETALDSFKLMDTMVAGKDSPLPPEAMDLLDSSSFLTQFVDCELGAAEDAQAGGTFNGVFGGPTKAQAAASGTSTLLGISGAAKALACPEELGTQGNEAIGNLLADLGIDGSPIFTKDPQKEVSKSTIFDADFDNPLTGSSSKD
jgi:hypothetical protein